MGRTLLSLALGLALSACWMSEEQFFGTEDWAHLDLDGSYTSEDANGHKQARVDLTVRPDGLVEGTSTNIESGEVDHSVMGLVAIAGGSGDYFIMVDRSDETKGGELYLLGHRTSDGGLEMFWPQCNGTPDIAGMKRESPDFGLPGDSNASDEAMICTFSSKAALQRAALEAEKFLAAPHIVEIQPMGRLRPGDDDDGPDDQGTTEADEAAQDAAED